MFSCKPASIQLRIWCRFLGPGETVMVSMHVLAMLGVGLLATAGGAQASSFVTLGVSTSTPSFIKVGTPEPMKMGSASTPSIVTLGDLVPEVTDEKVAAIPAQPEQKHGYLRNPMVIRGGIVGGASAAPAAAPAKATAAATPAAETKPADKPAGTATAADGSPQPEPQPQPAKP